MKERIEVRQQTNGQYYLLVIAANNEKIAHSEGYKTKQSARHAAKVLRRIALKSFFQGIKWVS